MTVKEGDVVKAVAGSYSGDFFVILRLLPMRRFVVARRLNSKGEVRLNLRGKFSKNFLLADEELRARALRQETIHPGTGN